MKNTKWIDWLIVGMSTLIMLFAGMLTSSKTTFISALFSSIGYGIAPAALSIAPYFGTRLVSKHLGIAVGVYTLGLLAVLATFYTGR